MVVRAVMVLFQRRGVAFALFLNEAAVAGVRRVALRKAAEARFSNAARVRRVAAEVIRRRKEGGRYGMREA